MKRLLWLLFMMIMVCFTATSFAEMSSIRSGTEWPPAHVIEPSHGLEPTMKQEYKDPGWLEKTLLEASVDMNNNGYKCNKCHADNGSVKNLLPEPRQRLPTKSMIDNT